MKKLTLVIALLTLTSCIGQYCPPVDEDVQQEAQSMYNTLGTSITNMGQAEARKRFGCQYENGDRVYVYKTWRGNKYVLVRYGRAVTYVE